MKRCKRLGKMSSLDQSTLALTRLTYLTAIRDAAMRPVNSDDTTSTRRTNTTTMPLWFHPSSLLTFRTLMLEVDLPLCQPYWFVWTRAGPIHDSNSRLRLKITLFDESWVAESFFYWFESFFHATFHVFTQPSMLGCMIFAKLNQIYQRFDSRNDSIQ